MSKADKYFKEEIKRIQEEGFNDKDYQVRPHWEDGTPAHTIKINFVIRTYDLSKEFPILTIRKQAFKNAVREILWIYQKKSNYVPDLGKAAPIWQAWAGKDNTIGKAYGYQVGKKSIYEYDNHYMALDQIDNIIYLLKNHPMDRRMIIDLWNPSELYEMNLPPCMYQWIFDVQDNKLNATCIQRSGDALVAAGAGGFNDVESAILVNMLAQSTGYKPGKLNRVVNNLHIYDKHLKYLSEILSNPEYDSPKIWINPEKKDFYSFTEDDFKLVDYKATPLKEKLEVAI